MQSATLYRPRPIIALGLWSFGNWRFKAYGIRASEPQAGAPFLDGDLIAAAQRHLESQLPRMERTPHRNHGFVVLHAGDLANWLLMDWWAHEDICCQILAKSEAPTPTSFEAVDAPFMACVWELVPIDHERRAWVDCVLAQDDLEAYIESWLPDGRY